MAADTRAGIRITPQVVIGLLVMVFGLILTGGNLGWFSPNEVLRYWPLAVIAIGLVKIRQTDNRSGQLFGGLLVLVGLWLMAAEFLDVSMSLSRWWPILIVVFGVLLVLRGRTDEAPTAVTVDQQASEIAFWSGVRRRIASPVFTRADLTAIMGGIEIDFRPSQPPPGGQPTVIDVFVIWGGIELRVPPDWQVSNQIVAIMGGADDKSTGTQDARHRLILRGFVIMGGVEIKT